MMVLRCCRALVVSLILGTAVGAASACASAGARVYVRVPPPPPVVEARVVAPGPGLVWIPGYYTWNNAAYVWAPGRWVRPVRARARWVPGHWVHSRRGWYFVDGHWR
jgi:hypothetical protein